MVEYHVPSQEEFKSFVLKEFRFLVAQYGFEEEGPAPNNPFSIRYKKGEFRVEVNGYSYGYSSGVHLLRLDERSGEIIDIYWLSTFVGLRRPDLLKPEFPEKRGQLQQLKKSAAMMRECASDVLSGDFSVLPEITRIQEEQKARSVLAEKQAELMKKDLKSQEAFASRDFESVVRLLAPYENRLSRAQRKRLEYARKHQ